MTNHENESIAKIVQRVRTDRFHGPKERARQIFLRYPPESVMSPKQAVKYLFDTYHIEKQVQRVVPYNISHNGLALNILVTWVGFFAETRQRLYDEAPLIVKNTGWYPLITGAFSYVSGQLVELVLDKNPRLQLKSTTDLELGEPLKLRPVSKTGFGTSFILETSSLSILMDFGFECPSLDCQDVDVFILSHVHQDHFGGFFDAVRRYRPRIIMMSEPTTRLVVNYLLSAGKKPEDFEMLMSKVLSVPLNTRLQFRDGGNMIFVDSNHMLGSMMSLIQFPRGNSLLYTSDCRIDHSASGVPGATGPVNSPLDTVSTLMKDTSLDCMILDATFVGREGGNTETQSLDGLLSKVRAALSVVARIFLMFDNAYHGFSLYE